jgi:hypothetical protein
MFLKKLTIMGLGLFLGISSAHALEKVPLNLENYDIQDHIGDYSACRCGHAFEFTISCAQHSEDEAVDVGHDHDISLDAIDYFGDLFTDMANNVFPFDSLPVREYASFNYGVSDNGNSYHVEGSSFVGTPKRQSCTTDVECVEFCQQTVGRKFDRLYNDMDSELTAVMNAVYAIDGSYCEDDIEFSVTCNGQGPDDTGWVEPCITEIIECAGPSDLPRSTLGGIVP